MKKFNIGLICTLLLIGSSCNDFLDVNTSPNEPSDAPVELIFPAATGSVAYVVGGWYQILGGMWSQHWTQSTGASQYRNIDAYDLQNDFLDDRQYGELYTGGIYDLERIRVKAKANENWSYYLMATVMQAYTFQILVDLYDKVPFTDALEGAEGNLTPTFDDGQVIYDSLIERIDYALEKDLLALSSQSPGSDDVLFQGDLDKWVQFANTLKLKMFLRQTEVRPTVAQAGVESLFEAPHFLEEDASFKAFKDEPDNRNPVYETGVDRLAGNITISRTLFDFLESNGDPRTDAIVAYPVNNATSHNTLAQGDYLQTTPTNILGLSTPTLEPLDPVFFMSASESYFLQAEAVARYGVTGDDAALYQLGIDASFEKFDVDDPELVYASGAPYEYPMAGTLDDKLTAILTQKWIALANSQGLEAFFEQNRTGIPNFFTPAVHNVTSGDFPRRLAYPQSERLRNPANVPAIVPITEPVWWDVND